MRYLTLLLLVLGVRAEEWDANNFPNPTTSQFQQCRMKTRSNICDPDGVLTEAARYRLDHDLKQLEARTRQENGATFCEKKGVTAAMAVARHVRGGSTDAVKHMANDMLRKWTLDSQCQKAIVIVVSTDDMKFWVARDDNVPVYADEFTEIFMQQKKLFQQSNYQEALTGVLRGTWEKALSKQGTPMGRPDSPGRPGFGDDAGGRQPGPGFRGGQGGGMKMPSIPGWIWLAIIFGVIPLLCCCLCCYLCCCRGKGSDTRAADPYSGDATRGGGRPAGRSGFSNLITSMGGAGIGSLIGNMISGRNRGGGGFGGGGYRDDGYRGATYGGGGDGRGMGYDRNPVYDNNQGRGGRGLYPSAGRKDEGGGGGW